MPRRSFYNMKIVLIILLLAGLVVEKMIDYDALFDVPMKKKQEQQPVPKSIGLIDQYLKQYNFGKYRNVIDDNIFAVNVIVESMPVEKKEAKVTKPFAMHLAITGIAITPERKIVMVWDKNKKESQVLLLGESLYEWQVISVDKEKVVMESESGNRYEFELNDESVTSSNIKGSL